MAALMHVGNSFSSARSLELKISCGRHFSLLHCVCVRRGTRTLFSLNFVKFCVVFLCVFTPDVSLACSRSGVSPVWFVLRFTENDRILASGVAAAVMSKTSISGATYCPLFPKRLLASHFCCFFYLDASAILFFGLV